MKSLEILDDIYLDLEDYLLYMEKDLQNRLKNEESASSIMEVNDSIKITQINIYDGLNKIKQDLEVLEIFKTLMFHNIKSIGFKSSIKSYEALFNMGIITKEQLEKLKQWLEENENERD